MEEHKGEDQGKAQATPPHGTPAAQPQQTHQTHHARQPQAQAETPDVPEHVVNEMSSLLGASPEKCRRAAEQSLHTHRHAFGAGPQAAGVNWDFILNFLANAVALWQKGRQTT